MLTRSVATTEGRSRISRAPQERCSAFCHLKMPAATLSKSFKGSQCGFVSIPTRILSICYGPVCRSNPRSKCDDCHRAVAYQGDTNRKLQITKGEIMSLETSLRNWQSNVDRVGKLFGNLSQAQLLQEVSPGKNRLIYLWGHLTAFNDALIPLLGFGSRIHPELDLMFISNRDRTVPTILLGEDLKTIWQQTSEILWTSFTKLSVADWLQKHSAVSEEDFWREPHRNRFTVVLGRAGHIAYHVGQAKLWERVQT